MQWVWGNKLLERRVGVSSVANEQDSRPRSHVEEAVAVEINSSRNLPGYSSKSAR